MPVMPSSFSDAAKSYAWIARVEYQCPSNLFFVNHRALHLLVNCRRVPKDQRDWGPMTVGCSLKYSVPTSIPIKKGQTNVSKRGIPTRICAAYHDAALTGTETLLSVDGSTSLDSNVPMQMASSLSFPRKDVKSVWALDGNWRICGPWQCVANRRREQE
jgi:hypothetical protein